jgi:hypothetical protein
MFRMPLALTPTLSQGEREQDTNATHARSFPHPHSLSLWERVRVRALRVWRDG